MVSGTAKLSANVRIGRSPPDLASSVESPTKDIIDRVARSETVHNEFKFIGLRFDRMSREYSVKKTKHQGRWGHGKKNPFMDFPILSGASETLACVVHDDLVWVCPRLRLYRCLCRGRGWLGFWSRSS